MAITTINGIPVYRATLCSENCGMKKISLVDAPAVLTDFQAFADAEQPMRYAVQDEDRRLVYGVIMRANFPIYRYSKQTGEYYILYDADTIREMAEKYLSEGRQDNVNLQHFEHCGTKENALAYIESLRGKKLDKHYTCYIFTDKQFSLATSNHGFTTIPYTTKQKTEVITL